MKRLFFRLLRLLLTPLRLSYRKRNGRLQPQSRTEVPNEVLLGMVREYLQLGHTATINVKGYSMRPFLENLRDRVVLRAAETIHDYDAVLAEIAPGHYVLHRVIRIEGDHVTLMGDGNIHGTEQCRLSDVVGVVETYLRPRRAIPATDPRLCRHIRLWRKLLPVRRYLLFIYKTIL